jgi:hypothetical protein
MDVDGDATPRHQFEWLAEKPSDFLERPGGWPATRYEAKALGARGAAPIFCDTAAQADLSQRRGLPKCRAHADSRLLEAIGNTPLIKLRKASEETGCTILGKAEFMNPGQSVKDRAALYIIKDALERKAAGPGGTIVEGTAGNTGIGLPSSPTPWASTVIVIPDNQSRRRRTRCGCSAPSWSRCRGALPQPQQLREIFRPARRALNARLRTAPSGPTSSTMSPTGGPTARPRPRRSGARPTARSTPSSAPSAPAARWPASAMALKAKNPTSSSASPIRRARRSTATTRRAS